MRTRVRDDIVRLAHRGLPVPEFARAVGARAFLDHHAVRLISG